MQCLIILLEYGGTESFVIQTVVVVIICVNSVVMLNYQYEQDSVVYWFYSSSSNLYSIFLPPMFDKPSNFNIHKETFIDASSSTHSGIKDLKDYQTILSNTSAL